MTMRRRYLVMAVVLTCVAAIMPTTASAVNSNAGTSGFNFLKINVGARAVAMGGAYTGLANDELSLYYNPAGIAGFEQKRLAGDYHNYFAEMQSGVVAYITPVGFDRALGVYISYLNYGDFAETDRAGNNLGEFSGGDLLVGVTYAMRYQYRWQFGASLKFIYEKLQDYSATGLATDLGVRYSMDRERWMFGAAIQNLGVQLSSLGEDTDKLPLTVRGGVATRPRGLPLIIAADIIVPIDNDPVFAIGGEYVEFKPLYIRLGWNSFGSNYRTLDSEDSWAGLGLGVGLDVNDFQISYAFTPGAELGDSHRITITGGI